MIGGLCPLARAKLPAFGGELPGKADKREPIIHSAADQKLGEQLQEQLVNSENDITAKERERKLRILDDSITGKRDRWLKIVRQLGDDADNIIGRERERRLMKLEKRIAVDEEMRSDLLREEGEEEKANKERRGRRSENLPIYD